MNSGEIEMRNTLSSVPFRAVVAGSVRGYCTSKTSNAPSETIQRVQR